MTEGAKKKKKKEVIKTKKTKTEHAGNIAAHENIAAMEKMREADERIRLIFDALPLGVHFWDRNVELVDCNQAALKFFGLTEKEQFLKNFSAFSPEYQPGGGLSHTESAEHIRKAFAEGYERFEWMHQTLDGEPIPSEITLVRIEYRGENMVVAYTRDMREQKRMMKEIDATATKLKTVVSNYPGIIFSADKNYEITLIDGFLLPTLADKNLFKEGENLKDALRKDEYKHIMERICKTFKEGPQEWTFDINNRVMSMTTTPIPGADGEVAGVVGRIDDVTEMTRIQNELKDSLEKTEKAARALETAQFTTATMFEVSPHINILFNSKFQVIDCNPAAITFMRFNTKQELINGFVERMAKSIPPVQSNGRTSVPLAERLMTAVKDGECKFETELNMLGEEKNLSVEMKRIPYETSFAVVIYVVDMTEIHKREMELARARELNELQLAKLDMAVKATKIGLWDMELANGDPADERSVLRWSPEFRAMIGFTDENDFPDTIYALIERLHPDDRDRVLAAHTAHINDKTGQTPYDLEYRVMMKNGEYAYFRASGDTVRDEEGNPIRIAGTLMNINEEKNILLDTERKKIEAEAANKAKSSFLSTMSHEIRTPMNAILGIVEIQLQNNELDQGVRTALEKIYTSGDLLLGIINDILDLSKIEAGKLELMIAKYEIASLISDTTQLNMMRIGSKPIEFELNVDENMPAFMMGDELRVKQILNNLLSNAFKYTAEGKVELSMRAEASEKEDESILVISVSDTGQGMTPEQVSRLFDEFSRFNTEANRTTEGTGLGMSITRNLIKLMNGDIAIESEVGKGSTFTVRLPQGKIDGEILGKEMADNLHKFRKSSRTQMKRVQITREPMPYGSVLIVDDVETNIFVARGLMAPYELKIDSVDSGYGAIEKVKNGYTYDIIFMDHMMPKMDGIEATKIIRGLGYDCPIVALTANAVSGQADIFLGNGFNDFISKPVDVRQLNAVLNKLIRDKQPPEVIEAAKQKKEMKEKEAKEKEMKNDQAANNDKPQILDINPRFAEIFARDANKSLTALDAIMEKDGNYDENDMRTYIIHVHGMKSALANIGKMDLSAIALKLEQIGRDGKTELMAKDTPAFVNQLREFVEEITPKQEDKSGGAEGEDKEFLKEKLEAVKAACEEYDENTADEALTELRKKEWPPATLEMLGAISEHLLHSDFDEVADVINKFMENN